VCQSFLQIIIDISNIADMMGKTIGLFMLAGQEEAQKNVRSRYR
jgi:hypothetical protein